MNILILRFSSMGDVILSTALFTHIKNLLPNSKISFLTNTLYVTLFKDDNRLNNVLSFDKKDAHKSITHLSSEKWDLIIDLQNSRRSRQLWKKYFPDNEIAFLKKHHIKRFLLLYLRISKHTKYSDVVRRYIQTSSLTSNSEDISPPSIKLFCSDNRPYEKLQSTQSFNPDRPSIAFAPFAAWKNKQWPLSSYAKVAIYFAKNNWNIILIGGKEDGDAAKTLSQCINNQCVSLIGTMNLYDIGCVLAHCTLMLGNDTGLSHMARACGVKTGMIFGATSRQLGFFPYGEPAYRIFESNTFCRPCHPHGGNVCWRFRRPCLKNITVDSVVKGLNELIQNT